MRNPNADTAGDGKLDSALTGAEKGLAEAERRFGKQDPPQRPARPAPAGAEKGLTVPAPDNGGEKGIAEARRRFGPLPGDAA